MVAIWILLLALVIFFMYMWSSGRISVTPATGGAKCNTCPGKNVPAVE